MIPKRYLIATLFIAAMLVLLAVVQAPRAREQGGVAISEATPALSLETFETIAEYRLLDGWAPRFQGTRDPDQAAPWPFAGGFEAPWEPASPFLGNQGFAMNGPDGRSEIVMWRGLEWRRYRFDVPIASARLDPARGTRLLVTLARGRGRFETRLMEVPEGRVLWSSDSGPWSRFSWDGKAALFGLASPTAESGWLLTSLPTEGDLGPQSLAAWNEPELPSPPRGTLMRVEQLWDDGKDLPGHRLFAQLRAGSRLWFPTEDRLWISHQETWTLWNLEDGAWKRAAVGVGTLAAQPPLRMGLHLPGDKGRQVSPLREAEWTEVPLDTPAWPDYDAAWTWKAEDAAFTAWDLRWGKGAEDFPKERQRQGLVRNYRSEWRAASSLRASVRGWLPEGPDIGLREAAEVAWVWVGDRVLLVKLQTSDRPRKIKALLKGR